MSTQVQILVLEAMLSYRLTALTKLSEVLYFGTFQDSGSQTFSGAELLFILKIFAEPPATKTLLLMYACNFELRLREYFLLNARHSVVEPSLVITVLRNT